jgi:hypothetical protein
LPDGTALVVLRTEPCGLGHSATINYRGGFMTEWQPIELGMKPADRVEVSPLVEFARIARQTTSWAWACQADLDDPDQRENADKARRKGALSVMLVSLKTAIERAEEALNEPTR